MSERLGRKKKGGATLEELRAAGAARPKRETPHAAESAPVEAERETAADTLYAVSPKEHADWQYEAALRQRTISATGLASVGEALNEFVSLLGTRSVPEIAAEASAALNPDERLCFYDALAAEEMISVAQVLALQNESPAQEERLPMPTPPYDERGVAAPNAKGLSFKSLNETELDRKRRAAYKKLTPKEFERGMERFNSMVPEDAAVEEEFREAMRGTDRSGTPDSAKPTYEETYAALKKELGAPYGIAYGLNFWKRGDGSAVMLEPDGHRWDIAVGEPHAFGMHGRVLMRYWTEQGFLDKEAAGRWLAEKKRLDPQEEKVSTISHGSVGDFRALVDEKLKSDAPYTMSAVGQIRPEKQRKDKKEPQGGKVNLGPEEERLGRTIKEIAAKFGAPSVLDGISYWKRPDGAAVIFDTPGSGVPKMPLIVRANGMHRFQSGQKRWTGTEFVDA